MRRVYLGLTAAILFLGACGESGLDEAKAGDGGAIQVECGVPGEWRALGESLAPEARPRGAACAFGIQCASGLCSANPEAGTCGVCLERRFLGESCGEPLVGCALSATCSRGVCRSTKKAAGQACGVYPKGGDRFECDDELFCDPGPPPWSSDQGVCTPLLTAGSTCDFFQACARGLRCSTGGVCAPAAESERSVPSLPVGAPCGISDGALVEGECAAGTACKYAPLEPGQFDASAACAPLPRAGEPCLADRCAEGLTCAKHYLTCGDEFENRCEPLRAEGEPCRSEGNALRDREWQTTTCAAGLECRKGRCERPCR